MAEVQGSARAGATGQAEGGALGAGDGELGRPDWFTKVLKGGARLYVGAPLVQWLGYLPSKQVARVRFPDGASFKGVWCSG